MFFHTLPLWEAEAIVSLIPIYLHFNKISGRHLRVASLPQQHTLNSLLNEHYVKKAKPHCFSIGHLICKQHSKIKSSIVDTNNQLNEILPFFDSLHKELSLGFQLVDNFPDQFSFYTVNCKNMEAKNTHQNNLKKIFNKSLSNTKTVLVISSASIKNNIATSISHVHNSQNILPKTIYHTMNDTSTEVELFSIRCRINQAVQVPNTEHIIVITDTIPAAKYILNSSTYPFQLHFITVSQDLRAFFNESSNNSIAF